MASELLSVGDLERHFGVSSQFLRNWEDEGKIPPSKRTGGGHRRYTQAHIDALEKLMNPTPPSSPAGDTHG